jgi:glycosyltransferase involved in cell wall biosynthesis
MRPTLTAAVIARDEEQLLPDCLRSIAWADEVLVLVDAATRDATREVAEWAGARVAERALDTFAGQRDAALALARTDWVLFVDADERVSAALRGEVCATVADQAACAGYWIPRRNILMGRVVRHAGWWPDHQLRLLKRASARYDPRRVVHEVPVLDGPAGYLEQPFVHLNYRTLSEFVRKQERYCRLDAQRWLVTYGRPRARAMVGQPVREFWRRYVRLAGFREGWLGLVLCLLVAWYAGKAVWLARQPQLLAAQRRW